MNKINFIFLVFILLLLGVTGDCEGGYTMEITNPLPADRMYTDDGQLIRCRVVEIGAWDMDTTVQKAVAHGLGTYWQYVISVQSVIINDSGTQRRKLELFSDAADPQLLGGGVQWVDSTNVYLSRRTGSSFDAAAFNDGVMNRGYLYIWYLG